MDDISDPNKRLAATKRHLTFVGHFVGEFSTLEAVMRDLLMQLSGLRSKPFMILVGFPRTSELLSKLQKIAALARLSDEAFSDISAAFKQLDKIVKLRDRLVHYGSRVEDDLSIAVRLKPETAAYQAQFRKHDNFSEAELWDAAEDLQLIRKVLRYHLDFNLHRGIMGPRIRERLSEALSKREPWRYIPPEQRPGRR